MKLKRTNRSNVSNIVNEGKPVDLSKRKALEKLAKYTPPAMLTILIKDSALAQFSPPPPP